MSRTKRSEKYRLCATVDGYTSLLQLVNAIVPDTQAAGGNLQEIARTALDRVQETANEFRNSVQTATQNQPAN